MLEDEGHWIKLMRKATLPTDANICLRISGKDIICKVTKDVNKEVELKVTCRIVDSGDETEEKYKSTGKENAVLSQQHFIGEDSEDSRKATKDSESSEAMLDFVSVRSCGFEGNMARTNGTEKNCEDPEERNSRNARWSDCEMDTSEVSSTTVRQSPSADEKTTCQIKSEDDAHSRAAKSSETKHELKAAKEDGTALLRCHICDYTTTERVSYDKHVRNYHSPPRQRSTSNLTNPRAFCEACKIQFMSVNTYRVHKKYYCKSRHEDELPLTTAPVMESAAGSLPGAFRPAADTVILRGPVNGGITPPIIQPQAIYAAISTNPLILLPCSLVGGQGLVPQGGVIPTGGPGLVVQTGISCPTIVGKPAPVKEDGGPPRKTSHPAMPLSGDVLEKDSLKDAKPPPLKRKMSEGDVLNLKKTCTSEDLHAPAEDKLPEEDDKTLEEQDSPLDLSIKRMSGENASKLATFKRRNSAASTGHPSSPINFATGSGSPPCPAVIASSHGAISPSASYGSDSNPCFPSHVPVVVSRQQTATAERISPLPPVLQVAVTGDKPIPTPGLPPPKLMKQGNNICEECHIVFYKYDNYMAHKKHYCAYRRRQLSALAAAAAAAAVNTTQEQSSDDNNSNHSGINEVPQGHQPDDASKSGIRRMDYATEQFRPGISKPIQSVYCCDACGVKFSTQDNLNAHQTYYCIKKADSAMSKATKKTDGDIQKIEPPFLGPEEWKCNYCDVSCSSYETIRRHLLTHTELRGFRCLVCGYKGNTLRGMRTHACEHITDDTTSIEEFISSTVITESGGIPVPARAMDFSDEDSDVSRDVRSRHRTSSNTSDSKEMSLLKKELLSATDHSSSEETLSSPKHVDNIHKDPVPKRVKTESGDSSSDANSNAHQESVNPLAFCDVVIKVENEQAGHSDEATGGNESPREENKGEHDSEYDSDDRQDLSMSPPRQVKSVICTTGDVETTEKPFKRKGKLLAKPNAALKHCDSCDISFYHLSNFLAHKKHYCVSRVIKNCLPETATVQ